MVEKNRFSWEESLRNTPSVEEVLAGGNRPQTVKIGNSLENFLCEILALDTLDPTVTIETGHEAWGIVYFCPKNCQWKKLTASKGINLGLINYTPVLPPRKSLARQQLNQVRWPLYVHSHLYPAEFSWLDRVSINIQKKLGLPYVGHMVVDKSRQCFLHLKGIAEYQGSLYWKLNLVRELFEKN